MLNAIELLTVVLPLLYALLTASYGIVFFREEPAVSRVLPAALSATIVLHIAYVALLTVSYRHIPLASMYETLTMVALSLTLVYWITERIVRTLNTGMFVLALASLFQTASSAFAQHDLEVNPIFSSPLFAVHTTAAVVGYTGFALSAVYGILYLMLHHELKANRFGTVYGRLPSLGTLASMHERAAWVGLVAMTAAILIGMVWLPNTEIGWALADPKVLLTVTIWTLYAIVLLSYRAGLGSHVRLIYISIFGFVLLVFSTLAVNLWLKSFHAFA